MAGLNQVPKVVSQYTTSTLTSNEHHPKKREEDFFSTPGNNQVGFLRGSSIDLTRRQRVSGLNHGTAIVDEANKTSLAAGIVVPKELKNLSVTDHIITLVTPPEQGQQDIGIYSKNYLHELNTPINGDL